MVKDSKENYKLNKSNLAQKTDGTAADITSGADGDAMRFVPEMWIDFENQNTRISNVYQAGWYHVPAHYWPLFGGNVLRGKLRSLAGKTITSGYTRAQNRAYAVANGQGYQQIEWCYLMAEIAMFMVMFKSLDSQGSLGRGYNTEATAKATGTHLTKGACWGSQTINSGAVFLWSEVTWEFMHVSVDGFLTDASKVTHIKNSGPYTDNVADMINTGIVWAAATAGSAITRFDGNNTFGIWPAAVGGTTSTHYCDLLTSGSGNNTLMSRGDWGPGLNSGIFNFGEGTLSQVSTGLGAALSFTPLNIS